MVSQIQSRLIEKDGVHAKVGLEFSAPLVTQHFNRMFQTLQRQANLPGFRAGKAPLSLVLKRIGGEKAVQADIRSELVERGFKEAVQALNLKPYNIISALEGTSLPQSGQAYQVELSIELFPEVQLGNLDEVVIDSQVSTTTEAQIEEELEHLQEHHAIQVPVERPVQPDDVIMVIFSDRKDKPDENAMAIDLGRSAKASQVFLGKSAGDEVEVPFSAIRSLLLGQNDDDEFDEEFDEFEDDADIDSEDVDELEAIDGDESDNSEDELEHDNHHHDDDDDDFEDDEDSDDDDDFEDDDEDDDDDFEDEDDEDEDSEDVSLKFLIKEVKEKEYPEINDEFAQNIGLTNLEALKADIRLSIQEELNKAGFDNQCEEFIAKLIAKSEISGYPQTMLFETKNDLIKDYANHETSHGHHFDYNELTGGAKTSFDEMMDEQSRYVIKRDFILAELFSRNNTRISDREFNTMISYIAQKEKVSVAKLKRERGEEWLDNFRYRLDRNRAVQHEVSAILKKQNPELAAKADDNVQDSPQETTPNEIHEPSDTSPSSEREPANS